MSENRIETVEQADALPAGQWVIAADGTEACLFDTHMGWPQRMWGCRANSGSQIRSFVALGGIAYPLGLADLVETGHVCEHRAANECGQCLRCGQPEVGEHREVRLDTEGLAAFRAAAISAAATAEASR